MITLTEIAAEKVTNLLVDKPDRIGFDTPFLVDLNADLGETTNVASEYPEIVKQLLAVAETARDDIGDYNRVGKNMRFFDPLPQRPKIPPLPAP